MQRVWLYSWDVEGCFSERKKKTVNIIQEKPNPITGQRVELTVKSEANSKVDKVGLKTFLAAQLPNHTMPKCLKVDSVSVGHRFKRA